MLDPTLGTVNPEEVFTSDEYIPDDEGTLFYGNEVAFGEYDNDEEDNDFDEEDMYEPDVFDDMEFWSTFPG